MEIINSAQKSQTSEGWLVASITRQILSSPSLRGCHGISVRKRERVNNSMLLVGVLALYHVVSCNSSLVKRKKGENLNE